MVVDGGRRHLLGCYGAISPYGGGQPASHLHPLKKLRGVTRSAMLQFAALLSQIESRF